MSKYLGAKVQKDDSSWISTISTKKESLMKPNPEFLAKLKIMEKMFKCHHGERTLKPGKAALSELADVITKHINLPEEVVRYFVRCRAFFRMRVLNREITSSRKTEQKIKKIII